MSKFDQSKVEIIEPHQLEITLSQRKKVARNTFFLTTSQVIAQASMAIIGIIIARTFGQHVYGQYTLAFSVVSAFSVIFTMGADQIVIRQVAQKQELAGKNFVTAFWIRLFAFPFAILIIGLAGWVLGYPADQQVYIWLAALITGLTLAADLPRVIFLGLQRMQYDLICRSIEKLSMLAIVIFLVLRMKETQLSSVMLGMVVGAVIGLFVSGYQLFTQIDLHPMKLTRSSLDLLRISAPLAGSMAIFFINQQLSIILLSRYTEIGEIGLFNAAYGVVAPFSIVPVAFVTAVLPVMAILFKSPDKRSQIFFNSYIALILIISFPIAMVLQWIGEDIIYILFGTNYMPAFSYLKILAWYFPIIFVSTFLNNTLIAAGKEKFSFWVTAFNLAATLLLGFILIPLYGSYGAAIVLAFVPLFGIILMLLLLSSQVRLKIDRLIILVFFGATLLYILGSFLPIQNTIIRTALSLGVYVLIILPAVVLDLRSNRMILKSE